MRKSEKIILIIIVFSFLIGAYFYPQMPEKTASHWNFRGEVDGYMLIFVLILAILISIYTIIYSYLEFRKQKTHQ